MKRGSHRPGLLGLMALLGVLTCAVPAPVLAQKGSSGGGGSTSGGGTGGGGADNKTGLHTSNLTFDDWGIYYNQLLPQGQIALSYSADSTTKIMTVQLSNINVPDGTIMTLETVEQWVTPTGPAALFSYYPITIQGRKGTLSVSTANAQSVMFLTPVQGATSFYIFDPAGRALMGAQFGG